MQKNSFISISDKSIALKELYLNFGCLNSGICPYCKANRKEGIIKNGFYNNIQLYFCVNCNKKFRETTSTIFYKSIFKIQQFHALLIYFTENLTAKQAASLLKENFIDEGYIISLRKTQKYFKLIRLVIQSFILKKITLMKFSGHLEIDEAHIYKKKRYQRKAFCFTLLGIWNKMSSNKNMSYYSSSRQNS